MTETSFSATTESDSLLLSGDIDAADHRALNELIDSASKGFTESLTVDLRGVTFLPSIIVGVLARATVLAKKNGARITLVAAEGSVPQRVLTVCKIPFQQVDA
ncbi:STAS domain-containing protein [Nocardioides zeae]|uniref:STAS domain-containing protein n=1 Tax=Nocardioides imazamoxiresistens TaxID=3231893 RepID=A0ABU3PZ39_9ACTN|nr:STAS domain-containing protein [Nocardioides zeae]MDT9594419.1 STAS domain-containing protein [Nocardioides zeae]